MWASVRGRPGPRLALPSCFRAISFRCQARRVPGVTIVAICDSARRPSPLARAASQRRWSSVKRSRRPPSSRAAPDSPRADVDCLLLLLIHPARDGNQHEPKWVENAHCSTVSWARIGEFARLDAISWTRPESIRRLYLFGVKAYDKRQI